MLTIIRESGMGADCVSGGEIRAATVSYTHLKGGKYSAGNRKLVKRMMTTAKLLLHCPDKPGILAEVTDFITVSYTHLDVYKRQSHGRVSRADSRTDAYACGSNG